MRGLQISNRDLSLGCPGSFYGLWVVSRLNIWNIRDCQVTGKGGVQGEGRVNPKPCQFRKERHSRRAEFVAKKKSPSHPYIRGRVRLTRYERAHHPCGGISSSQQARYPRSPGLRGVAALAWILGPIRVPDGLAPLPHAKSTIRKTLDIRRTSRRRQLAKVEVAQKRPPRKVSASGTHLRRRRLLFLQGRPVVRPTPAATRQ